MTDTHPLAPEIHPLALAHLETAAALYRATNAVGRIGSGVGMAAAHAEAAWKAAGCPIWVAPIDWDGRPEICPHDRQPCDGDCPAPRDPPGAPRR